MEDDTMVTLRLPAKLVERLEEMITKGKYDNLSEAVADCIQNYLDSNPDIPDDSEKKEKPTVDMESLMKDDYKTMDELIRDAAKKYTKDHIDN